MGSPPAPHYSAPAQSFHGMDVDFDKLVWKQVVILHGQGVLNWKLFEEINIFLGDIPFFIKNSYNLFI